MAILAILSFDMAVIHCTLSVKDDLNPSSQRDMLLRLYAGEMKNQTKYIFPQIKLEIHFPNV